MLIRKGKWLDTYGKGSAADDNNVKYKPYCVWVMGWVLRLTISCSPIHRQSKLKFPL